MIQFALSSTETGRQFVTVFVPSEGFKPADDTHPNFKAIVAACHESLQGNDVSIEEVAALFDVTQTLQRKFQRLSDRVSVDSSGVYIDGDPVDGTLEQQILDFLDAGEDFQPLVNFYEKLLTNPLGDVRQGVYDWIKGQTASGGKVTIATDGDLLGYKSCQSHVREDGETVYRPSRASQNGDRVNGVEVPAGSYIEQKPGDVVEMPRSKVLHAPSVACADGLHIGTYNYAKGFSGDTVLLVKFNPRDIVSLPDSNSTWKLRVCRYTVLTPVEDPLDVPVYLQSEAPADEADAWDDEDAWYDEDAWDDEDGERYF